MAWVSSVQEQRQYQSALILHEQNQVVLFSFLHHPAGVTPPHENDRLFQGSHLCQISWLHGLVWLHNWTTLKGSGTDFIYSSHIPHISWLHLRVKQKQNKQTKKNHTVAEHSALKFSVVNHRGKQRGARHNWFACLIKCWYFRKHQIVKLI